MTGKLLDNKVVVVVGAGGLLGREFVSAAADEGAKVVLADISASTERIAARLNRRLGAGAALFVPLDITSKRSINSAITDIRRAFGKIDAVVNAAYPRNKNYGRRFEKVEYADFCENVNLHLGGYFLVSQQFAEFFRKQGRGNIINISSVYGIVAPRFLIYKGTGMTMPVEYAAVKSAIILLTRYMAGYYAGCGIRFNSISPGGIADGQPASFTKAYKGFCLSKGMLDRRDINGTLLYLLSDISRHVNGQNIVVDDGFTL